jgi:RHS repeat-associated protein
VDNSHGRLREWATLAQCLLSSAASAAKGSLLASWTYDTIAKGQLSSSATYVGSKSGKPGDSYVLAITGYNAAYEPTGTKTTTPATTPDFGKFSYLTSMTYDRSGLLATVHTPAVGLLDAETVKYPHDPNGRLEGVEGNDAIINEISLTANGQISAYTLADGPRMRSSEYAYDGATDELAEVVHYTSTSVTSGDEQSTTSTTLADTAYQHDDAGEVTSQSRLADGVATDTQCYGYDHLQNLTQAWTPASADCTAAPAVAALGGPAPYWNDYAVDPATGNRTSVVQHPVTLDGVAWTSTYSYPAAGGAQPHAVQSVSGSGSTASSTAYTYDASGNTVTRGKVKLTYDELGRVATVKRGKVSESSVYDAAGTLLLRSDPVSGTTLFLGDTELHRSPKAAKSATSAVRTYRADGVPVGERTTTVGVAGSRLSWLFPDPQNTAVVEADPDTGATTTRYADPFGNPRGAAADWSSDHDFLNAPSSDLTGLSQLGAREYDPVLGRFMSVDSVLTPTNPQQNNGYSYSQNNPVSRTDPTGLCSTSDDSSGCWGNYATSDNDYKGTTTAPPPAGNGTSKVGGVRNNTSPWGLGFQWLTGTGQRHQEFNAGDPFTELLRKHEQIQIDKERASKDMARGDFVLGEPLDDEQGFAYSLGGVDGVAKYFKDYGTLLDGGLTGNLAVTYLGSYNVSIVPIEMIDEHAARVTFTVANSSTLASATHLPLYGIIPGYSKFEDWENSLVPVGPMSRTDQLISWDEVIHWK